MNFFTYRISLDIRETTSQAFINVKKNDTARKFIFTLTDNGRAYQITEGCTAVFRAKKPDGTILYNNCPIVGNAMEYYLTSQTVAAVGIVECEITLYGSNSKQITSPRFSLAVDDVLYSDSEVESKDEFTALTGAIEEVRASKAFTIKLTTTNDGITADKTFTEIAEKVNASKSVVINMDGWEFPVSYSVDSGKIVFSSLWANIAEIPNTVTFAVNSSDVWNVVVSDIPTTAQVSAKYTKPASGIPKADLATAVQASLGKADSALQEHQSLAAYRTASAQDNIDITKQDKLIAGENITIAADGRTISATGGGGGGSTVELDTTLSEAGKAADAKAVGDALSDKQDTISDLVNIRSGAAKGATALQSVPSTYRTASAQDVVDNGLNERISAIEGKEAGWNGKYSKPTGGIPKADLATAVQASLGKADSALQEHQSLAAYRTASAQDAIDSGKVDKVTGKGLSSNDYTDAAKAKVDAIPANPQYTDTVFSGSYNDLTDKPTIPAPVTEQTVSGWGFTKNTGTYSKPTDGIPKSDLANDVQASLGKAETALQEHQSLAAYRTAAAQDNIDSTKQDKLIAGENITIAEDGKTISATGGGGVLPVTLTLGAPIQQGNSIGWFYTADQGKYEIKDAIDAGITVLKCSLIYEDNPNEVAEVLYLNFSSMNSDAIFVGFNLPGVYYELSFPISGAGEGMLRYITLPTKTSELENDAGYLTLATLPKYEGVVE